MKTLNKDVGTVHDTTGNSLTYSAADDPVQLECSINTQDMSFYVNYIYN